MVGVHPVWARNLVFGAFIFMISDLVEKVRDFFIHEKVLRKLDDFLVGNKLLQRLIIETVCPVGETKCEDFSASKCLSLLKRHSGGACAGLDPVAGIQ